MLRACSALLLALFVNASVGTPIADAVWFHAADGGHAAVHVEAAGADCHAERCSLGAPAIPLAAQLVPPAQVSAIIAADVATRWTPHTAPLDRTPSHAPGSRAPPA